jgi:hypothetical protein
MQSHNFPIHTSPFLFLSFSSSFSFLFFPLYTSAEHTMNETGRLCSEP